MTEIELLESLYADFSWIGCCHADERKVQREALKKLRVLIEEKKKQPTTPVELFYDYSLRHGYRWYLRRPGQKLCRRFLPQADLSRLFSLGLDIRKSYLIELGARMVKELEEEEQK
jgi:hypothetical protein